MKINRWSAGLAAMSLLIAIAGVGLFRSRHRDGSPRTAHQPAPPGLPLGDHPYAFFPLTIALSIPFWLLGTRKLPLPVNLPVSALVGFTPMLAALILTYRERGAGGVRTLFARVLDYKKIANPLWYLPTLLLAPLIYLLSYLVMRLTGMPLPEPKIPYLLIVPYFIMYFFEAVGEELGYMGYAIDSIQDRWGALKGSFIFWAFYAVWHTMSFIQTENSPGWVAWQTLSALPLRVLYVWIYNNTGRSVFSAILLHDLHNVCWSLFPNNGSHYNPFVTGLITLAFAALAALGWDAKTLTRFARRRVFGS